MLCTFHPLSFLPAHFVGQRRAIAGIKHIIAKMACQIPGAGRDSTGVCAETPSGNHGLERAVALTQQRFQFVLQPPVFRHAGQTADHMLG